ncbi:MAG TPA: DUF3693 domain-containing protein [Telluria sp.]
MNYPSIHRRRTHAAISPEESKLRTSEYLDLARQHLGLPSDYALQKPLGVTKQLISKYRTGKETLSDSVAFRVAEATGIPREKVLIDVQIERAKTSEEKAAWQAIMEKISASFNTLLSGGWHGRERRISAR